MTIVKLNTDSTTVDSKEYRTRAYQNTTKGKKWLEAECPPEIVQQVYAVWGDTPTVEEPIIEYPAPALPGVPIDQRISAIEDAFTALMFGEGA